MKAIKIIRRFAAGDINHEKCGVCHFDQDAQCETLWLFGEVFAPAGWPTEGDYLWYWDELENVPDFGSADFFLSPTESDNEGIWLFKIEN